MMPQWSALSKTLFTQGDFSNRGIAVDLDVTFDFVLRSEGPLSLHT